jgi:hypothetical protein
MTEYAVISWGEFSLMSSTLFCHPGNSEGIIRDPDNIKPGFQVPFGPWNDRTQGYPEMRLLYVILGRLGEPGIQTKIHSKTLNNNAPNWGVFITDTL